MKTHGLHATIIGAGPVGCVLAAILAERDFDIEMYEKRPDMRREDIPAGRSINLVLTNRGLRALERIGLREKVLELTVPVYGRMMHSVDGELTFQPYGKDESECNYSVSRGKLNEFLLDAAEAAGVRIHFDRELVDADFEAARLTLNDTESGEISTTDADIVFGADGAPSAVRKALVERPEFEDAIDLLDYGYKELRFPADDDGSYAMDGRSLHIWPRGHHMLMGLANLDGSFTGTIYLPHEGEGGFEQLDTPEEVVVFFEEEYPDAIPLLGDFAEEFLEHPTGTLGTVRCEPWHLENRVLLIGDAAHGIVPFFGQGLNCGFEDCVILADLLDEHDDFDDVFARFYASRKPNADAIADMALENFIEMRDKVADDAFLMRKRVESIVEKNLPDIYRSRYAIVMYSYIPYRVAYEVGEVQEEILAELVEGIHRAEDVDLDEARRLIEEKLVPLYERYDVDLDF